MEEFFNAKQKVALQYFQDNIEKLIIDPLYKLKFVIIHENEIAGVFDTFDLALTDAVAKYSSGEYIIQQVLTGKDVINYLYAAIA